MTTSSLSLLEALKNKLFEFPALVDALKNKDYNFLERLETWMKETETILVNNKQSESAVIAGYRSKIIAPLFTDTQKRSARKRQLQVASEVLFDLQNTIFLVISPIESRVNEARDLLTHLLNITKQSGALKYNESTDFQIFTNQLWKLFSTHEQLKPSSLKILTLISGTDALRIIAEEINLAEWM